MTTTYPVAAVNPRSSFKPRRGLMHMNTILNFIRPPKMRILDYQVAVFQSWRQRRGIVGPHEPHSEFINLLCRHWTKDDILEFEKEDMDWFLELVADQRHGSQYAIRSAKTAISSLLRFYKARGKNLYQS